jgi:hypothetical protein
MAERLRTLGHMMAALDTDRIRALGFAVYDNRRCDKKNELGPLSNAYTAFPLPPMSSIAAVLVSVDLRSAVTDRWVGGPEAVVGQIQDRDGGLMHSGPLGLSHGGADGPHDEGFQSSASHGFQGCFLGPHGLD